MKFLLKSITVMAYSLGCAFIVDSHLVGPTVTTWFEISEFTAPLLFVLGSIIEATT